MKLLALAVLAFALVGCTSAPPPVAEGVSVGYFHDEAHDVSCWTFGSGGGSYTAAISCLPDSQVTLP